MILAPSTNFVPFTTARGSFAAMGAHLMRKSGTNLTTNFPVDVASVAPAPDVTLVHLKERNAFIPIHASTTPMAAGDITTYNSLLTVNDGYSANVATDFSTKLAAEPSLCYLDVWNAALRSSDLPLAYPNTQNVGRPAAEQSQLATVLGQKIEKYRRSLEHSNITTSTVSVADLSNKLAATPWNLGEMDAQLAEIIPADCTLVPFTLGPTIEPIYPEAVALKVNWTDTLATGVTANGSYYYWIVPPRGSNPGWTLEGVCLQMTNGLTGTGNITFLYELGWSQVKAACYVQVDRDGNGSSVPYVWKTSCSKTSDAWSGLFNDFELTYNGSSWSTVDPGVYADRISILSGRAPISVALQTQIGYYLADVNGAVPADDATALAWWAMYVDYYFTGVTTSALVTNAIPSVDTLATPKPVPSIGAYVYIGRTFSVDKPGGTDMPIAELYSDVFTSDKDGRSVWVMAADRTRDAVVPYMPIVEKYVTSAELASYMSYLQTQPNFPASITPGMITDLTSVTMGIMVLSPISKAEMDFANSSLNGKAIDGFALTSDKTFIGQDDAGALVSYDQGIKELTDNGFFKDATASVILLPITGAYQSQAEVVLTVDVGDVVTYDNVTFTAAEVKVLVENFSARLAFAPTAAWLTDFGSTNPGEDSNLPLLNVARVSFGLSALTAMPDGGTDNILDCLNPLTYKLPCPLQSTDATKVYDRLALPYTARRVDSAMIGRQIPEAARLFYTMASKALATYLDPL